MEESMLLLALCPECGLQAEITPNGQNSYQLRRPDGIDYRCPVLSQKTREKGRLSESELDCEYLDRAIYRVFDRWSRGLPLY
jgi:hypothetical protein